MDSEPAVADQERRFDTESQLWIDRLDPHSPERETALAGLHALLLKAARAHVARRCAASPQLRGDERDDLARQSADHALVAVLENLGDFRGVSRFTTWASKFALVEANARARRRAWEGRRLPRESGGRALIAGAASDADLRLLAALREAIDAELGSDQRYVLTAVTLDGVPIDVLAERLDTTRDELYKTIHDARCKLRARLAEREIAV